MILPEDALVHLWLCSKLESRLTAKISQICGEARELGYEANTMMSFTWLIFRSTAARERTNGTLAKAFLHMRDFHRTQ